MGKPSSSTESGSPWDLAWKRGIFQGGCCVGIMGHYGTSGPQVVNALGPHVFLWPQHLLCGGWLWAARKIALAQQRRLEKARFNGSSGLRLLLLPVKT